MRNKRALHTTSDSLLVTLRCKNEKQYLGKLRLQKAHVDSKPLLHFHQIISEPYLDLEIQALTRNTKERKVLKTHRREFLSSRNVPAMRRNSKPNLRYWHRRKAKMPRDPVVLRASVEAFITYISGLHSSILLHRYWPASDRMLRGFAAWGWCSERPRSSRLIVSRSQFAKAASSSSCVPMR